MANAFNPMEVNMQPLQSLDSEFTVMYLTVKQNVENLILFTFPPLLLGLPLPKF